MRFDLSVRQGVRDHLAQVAADMATWDVARPMAPDLYRRLVGGIQAFPHGAYEHDLHVGGVDGSGDYPALSYGDSFVYLSVAASSLYRSDAGTGLSEVDTGLGPLVEFTWLTTNAGQRAAALLGSFEHLTGRSLEEVLTGSDYGEVSGVRRRGAASRQDLIVPPAHDAGNLGIQLRTTAELAAALRLIEAAPAGAIVLTDGTMSLPFAGRQRESLFFEHLRRYCCVRARGRGVWFASVSKSSGLPSSVRLEAAAEEKLGTTRPEHWFLRVPSLADDGWSLWPDDGPTVPPPGAVSFLFRLHRSTPIMRLDLDAGYWPSMTATEPADEVARRLFAAIDYASLDQRSYGYPYPIKAAHDRASLTEDERVTLRKQIIEAAVAAGMRHSSFRDPRQLTGHG